MIYAGPCPPDPACPCQPPLPPPPPDPPCYPPCPAQTAYAYYAQTGALVVSEAGDPIPLRSVMRESPAFTQIGDTISVCRPGTYLAAFTLSLPASAECIARIDLTLGDEAVPGACLTVNKVECAPATYQFQTVFTAATPGTALRVVSSSAMSVTAATPSDVIAALTITQLQ